MKQIDCDPKHRQRLNEAKTKIQMEDAMAQASDLMELEEILAGKSQDQVDMFWLGYNFLSTRLKADFDRVNITYRLCDPDFEPT